jgi:sec-independent protein translocase protein TatB
MFDIGWSELFLIVLVAVVVVGPKDLPKMMRTIGRWTGRARAMADQFRRSFDDMARQSELEEMRAEMMKLHNEKSLSDIKRETDRMLGHLPSSPTASLVDAPRATAPATPPGTIMKPPAAEVSAPEAPQAEAPQAEAPLHREEP